MYEGVRILAIMNGLIRQRSPGTWELTLDLGRDVSGKWRRKYVTVRGSRRDVLGKVMDQEVSDAIDVLRKAQWGET